MKSARIAAIFALLSVFVVNGQTGKAPSKPGKPKYERRYGAGVKADVPKGKPPKSKSAAVSPKATEPSVTLLGSVATPSPAQSVAIQGNYAYVCNQNQISVVDITNASSPTIVGTATSPGIQESAILYCSIQSNTLMVFADQANTQVPNSVGPHIVSFNLTNPAAPVQIAATPMNKRFFEQPLYIGPRAYVPIASESYFLGYQWDGQTGDLIAVDISNPAAPAKLGELVRPGNPIYGGDTSVFGATQAGTTLVYIGGSTSKYGANDGLGRLQVVDISDPAAMKVVAQRLIPGTIHLHAPLIQGTVGVAFGNDGGYVGNIDANPFTKGKIVISTLDVSNRREPTVLTTTATAYKVGVGGGSARIGSGIFAFGGVADASDNPVVLVVDATNPLSPIIQGLAIPQAVTSLAAIGDKLYATHGAGGFSIYSIPGTDGGPTCPVSIDTAFVMDRSAGLENNLFVQTKTAMKSFIDNLHLPEDHGAVISFTNSASVQQTLTGVSSQIRSGIDAILPGGAGSIGAGIAAAQAELLGPRRTPGASPVMIVFSDGADAGAPNSTSTLAAANAAKDAGIRIISVQYGRNASLLMQSIASSAADFQLVSQ